MNMARSLIGYAKKHPHGWVLLFAFVAAVFVLCAAVATYLMATAR